MTVYYDRAYPVNRHFGGYILEFLFIANDRALDFVNTSFTGGDVLTDFAAYVAWLHAASVLSAAEARSAAKFAGTAEARSAFRALTELRTAVRHSVEAINADRLPSRADLKIVNERLVKPPLQLEIVSSGGKLLSNNRLTSTKPERLLFFVAAAAQELLTQKDLTAIRQCAGDACTHFFYDASKNRSRRWCSMAGCGNREKVAALRKRQRGRPGG